MTVFVFNIWYIDLDSMQHRYVVAETEEKAIEKLEKYRNDSIANGISDFIWAGPWVNTENVIF